MELFGTAVIGALAGQMAVAAADEGGRRGVGLLAALLGRARLRRRGSEDEEDGQEGQDGQDGDSGDGEPPTDPEEARRRAEEVVNAAREDRAIAALLEEFARQHLGLPAVRVPAPHRRLVDRQEQLAEVRRLVGQATGRPLLLLLLGERDGAGSSLLARHLSHELADLLPDHHPSVDLAGPAAGQELTPDTAATELLLDLRVPPDLIPSHLTGKVRALRDRLAGRRSLVVLDNARSAEQVAPLLVGAPGTVTVVTASHRMPALVAAHGARVVHVGPLAQPDAEELLAMVAGEDRFRAGGEAARQAARRCGGHARTLCDLGALAHFDRSPDWDAMARELDGAAPDPAGEAAGRAYRGLTTGAARLHRLLGRLPRVSHGVPALAALAGRDRGETETLLGELTGGGLLEREGERVRLSAPAHRHAAAQPEAEAAGALRAWAEWCLRTAAEAQTSVMPGRWYLGGLARELAGRPPAYADPAAALGVLRAERPVLVAAVGAAADAGLHDVAWQLCESMWALHLRLGFHDDCLTTHGRGIEAARACGDRRAEARMLVQRGFSLWATRQHERAEAALRQAYATEPEDHPRGMATAVESLGLLRLDQGRHEEAGRLFRDALPHAERAGDPRALALLAHHIGRALGGRRRFAEALEQLDGALRAMRALPVPDRYNVGRVLTSVGETRLAAGDPAAAAGPLDEALEIMMAEGAWIQEAAVAELRARCEPDDARGGPWWERAWQLRVALGDAEGVARTRERLTAAGRGDPGAAQG
ncbi:tetratricopeptide repeat protein [Streptomyces sp. 6N223]|uniref:tetratricopeptide repeat protein n=1 Tax=Streptomyces sp. 6N223 TaxID=3457412 RepID=UPI003FD0458B